MLSHEVVDPPLASILTLVLGRLRCGVLKYSTVEASDNGVLGRSSSALSSKLVLVSKAERS